MLVPLSRNPFPAGEKVVSRGKDYICQRCNAQEKSTDVREQKLESKFRNLQKTKMFNLRKLTIIWPCSHNAKFNANIFFTHQKFHKHHQISKLGNKILCSWRAILHWVISCREHYQ